MFYISLKKCILLHIVSCNCIYLEPFDDPRLSSAFFLEG